MAGSSLKPVPKVAAGMEWGALAVIVVGAIAVFYPEAYARIPDTEQFTLAMGMFAGSAVSSVAGYFKRDNR